MKEILKGFGLFFLVAIAVFLIASSVKQADIPNGFYRAEMQARSRFETVDRFFDTIAR